MSDSAKNKKVKASKSDSQCSAWTFGECIATNGVCGKGKKQGTRIGTNCQIKSQEFKCKVPCKANNSKFILFLWKFKNFKWKCHLTKGFFSD